VGSFVYVPSSLTTTKLILDGTYQLFSVKAGMSHPSTYPHPEGVSVKPVFVLGVAFLALAVGSIHWLLGVATLVLVSAGYYIHARPELISWLKGYVLYAQYMSRQERQDNYPIRRAR
jgi:hypothetical protein